MTIKLTDIIRRPLITEKTSIQREDGRTILLGDLMQSHGHESHRNSGIRRPGYFLTV